MSFLKMYNHAELNLQFQYLIREHMRDRSIKWRKKLELVGCYQLEKYLPSQSFARTNTTYQVSINSVRDMLVW